MNKFILTKQLQPLGQPQVPVNEEYFQWKCPSNDGSAKNPNWRLKSCCSDPFKYEEPYDLLFRSVYDATQALKEDGFLKQAKKEKWVLVHVTHHALLSAKEINKDKTVH